MKAKRLIEVAMPIKEISAESQRDGRLAQGHIKSIHQWWARRPIPTCRAVVFASLVPDPLDDNCPVAFIEALKTLFVNNQLNKLAYKPYDDIPYTAISDPMADNLRNRLLMFIGKFSNDTQNKMIKGEKASSKDQLSDASLIKWESRNNDQLLNIARELIWISHNSERNSHATYQELHDDFNQHMSHIRECEEILYSIVDRHTLNHEVLIAQSNLNDAINNFHKNMPIVFDPFAGGGTIPLEAARLGCDSYGNDINPVAHIIERCSAEYPQKYGKKIVYSESEFKAKYGESGYAQLIKNSIPHDVNGIAIPNVLSFDVEYYAQKIIDLAESKIGHLYPNDDSGNKLIALLWARTATCSNPRCKAKVPMLKDFYLANNKNHKVYLQPIISGSKIDFVIKQGTSTTTSWQNRGNLFCPCCGSVTSSDVIKKESNSNGLHSRLLAAIVEKNHEKEYILPTKQMESLSYQALDAGYYPTESLAVGYSQALPCCTWGYTRWGDLFSSRQLLMLNTFVESFHIILSTLPKDEYSKALKSELAMWIDRIVRYNTSFSNYETAAEKLNRILVRQEIHMIFDYPESNPFCGMAGSARNQLECIIETIDSESRNTFFSHFTHSSSGEKGQFKEKEITAVVTDPPYYDAMAYADLSDFYYTWLKRLLYEDYPLEFSTPQTPKEEECTALNHHHSNPDVHFEGKLTEIFDAIEYQTSDIVSIMFAHQTTKAWTTLCNAILGARMNITGSWPMDTESKAGVKMDKAFLESSVTVACRPSEKKGFGDYKIVKEAIKTKVEKEVEDLYKLGFRGADLLTACFGQAVSEFGKYKVVEKADGSEVNVSELLDMARKTAFDTLLKGVQGDDFTRFYIGWLQMNGMGETDFDDATKFTRVGMQVDVSDIFSKRLLIRDGNKQHLATANEHLGSSLSQGTHPEDSLIDQVHRAMLSYESGDRHILLTLLHNLGVEDPNAPFWRLAASLKELLPDGKDLEAIEGLLGNGDNLRQESREVDQMKPEQLSLGF